MTAEHVMAEPNSEPDLLAAWIHSAAPELDRGGTFTSTVDGVLHDVDAESLWIRAVSLPPADEARDVGVAHHLPAEIDLTPLLGQVIRATMVSEEGDGESRGLTLIVSSAEGRVWFIARSGTVQGITHVVSGGCGQSLVHAALSQRPLGPLVIGTAELQWLVPLGRSAVLGLPDGAVFRALLVDRRPDGTAWYAIADQSLFAESYS